MNWLYQILKAALEHFLPKRTTHAETAKPAPMGLRTRFAKWVHTRTGRVQQQPKSGDGPSDG